MSKENTTETSEITTAEQLFSEVQSRYSTRAAFVQTIGSPLAFVGVNRRLGARRLTTLRSTRRAQFLSRALSDLSTPELKAFMGLAVANKEQADAAFRYTAIVNFTAPLTVLIVTNQIVGGELLDGAANLSSVGFSLFIALCVAGALGILYILIAAQGGVQFARDIYHLTLIEQARRPSDTAPNNRPEASEEPEFSVDL